MCRGAVVETWTEAGFAAAKEEDRLRIARHEASHAVISLALGRHVEYVSVQEGDPHVMERGRADGPGWLHGSLFVTLAGDLGEPEPEPFDHADGAARIAACRSGSLGTCDSCRLAYYLAGVWPERSDAELALLWGHLRAVVLNLMAHPTIVETIDRLAEALGRRKLLLADELHVIANVTALRTAAAEVLGPSAPREIGEMP
ncbi:hypothetical protein MMR14E_13230 [Methylobacterium mesophilicum]